ncbi:uncharacterized protein LOC113361356 [Papaver somniferum]|uniref:uncharacterized protein LOC113361356 n=1 Tax=Papaver somniferum TaxID=3469 RepID=UPI000E6FC706|nr:uncharacterized protein LOC113361356 [Papaver somniferum]
MPRVNCSCPEPCLSPISQCSASQNANDLFQCPFRGFEGCKNGVGGRGFVRGYIVKHLTDKHLSNDEGKERCRDRIQNNGAVYALWEDVLQRLKMWLCTQCMHLHAWRKCCKVHGSVIVPAPFTGGDVEFLIHGIPKPAEEEA